MMTAYDEGIAGQLFDLRVTNIIARLKLLRCDVVLECERSEFGGIRVTVKFPGPHPDYLTESEDRFLKYPHGFYDFARLHPVMGEQEIIREILTVYITLQEHETLESFQLDGRPVISPHRMGCDDWYFEQRRRYYSEMIQV